VTQVKQPRCRRRPGPLCAEDPANRGFDPGPRPRPGLPAGRAGRGDSGHDGSGSRRWPAAHM